MNDWVDAEHHVDLAHEHYDAGRWDEAENELRQALSLNPYQTEWQFNLGLTLEAAGRYEAAADAFVQCSKLHVEHASPDANSTLLVGVNLIRAAKPELALVWLDEAEKIEPMNVAVVVHRIEALTDLKRFDEAEEAFYLGQQVDPEYPELYAVMGETLQRAGHHERAVWCLREAARLDPGLPRVRAHLASAYARLGRLERSRQLYLQELRVDPGDPETLLDLGDLLVDMHRYTEAGEKFRRVLELFPDNADAHFSLAELAEIEGRLPDALVHFDVVLRIDKDYLTARTRLAKTLLHRGRDEDMPRIRDLLNKELNKFERTQSDEDGLIEIKVLRDSVRTESVGQSTKPKPSIAGLDEDELEELGRTLVEAGMLKQATRVYMMLLATAPASHKAFHGLSVSALQSGDFEAGIDAAKKSLEYRPVFVPAMHNLVLAYYRQGQYIRARYWLTQAMRHEPDDVQLRRLRMRLRVRTVFGVLTWISSRVGRITRPIRALVTRPAR
ncbi:MAG: tetratricopeptide repeat protein [Phycisphaerales bacterium]|nr:tetratricopeptide repeat protein [Phycisphaerales bacterium]